MRIQRRVARTALTMSLVVAFALAIAAPAEAAAISVHPVTGPPGVTIKVQGSGFPTPRGHVEGSACRPIRIYFLDANGTLTLIGRKWAMSDGTFHRKVVVPLDAAPGQGTIEAKAGFWRPVPPGGLLSCYTPGFAASAAFTVTSG
jgi:hypothetical protein